MATHRKTRTPQFDSFPIEFVCSSGEALTQGAMHPGMDGVQMSVCGPMKTAAGCFKYAPKIGGEAGPAETWKTASLLPRAAAESR
jgi:hypothetical protein